MNKKIMLSIQSGKTELIFFILYKLLIDFSYITIIRDNYNEYNQFITDFSLIKYIIAFVFLITLYLLNIKALLSVSKMIVKLFLLLMYVPISTVYACKNDSTVFFMTITAGFFIFIMTASFMIRNIKIKKEKKNDSFIELTTNLLYYGFIAITVILVLSCIYFNGLPSLTALNLRDVYEVRQAFYLPRYLYYLYEFEAGFIIYFLIIVNMKRKNIKALIVFILIQFLFFLWKGDKSAIFGLITVIAVYLISGKLQLNKMLCKLFFSFTSISLILFYTVSSLPFLLLIRRMLIIPANLKFIYYDFFMNHDYIGIVGTVLNSFLKIPDPYAQLPYQNLISKLYFNKVEMWSNTGFLAEGYARGGIIGSLLISGLMGIILYLIYLGVKKTDSRFILSIAIIPMITLNDGYLLTSFTFGSVGLLCVTCFFFDLKYLKTDFNKIINIKGRWLNDETANKKSETE